MCSPSPSASAFGLRSPLMPRFLPNDEAALPSCLLRSSVSVNLLIAPTLGTSGSLGNILPNLSTASVATLLIALTASPGVGKLEGIAGNLMSPVGNSPATAAPARPICATAKSVGSLTAANALSAPAAPAIALRSSLPLTAESIRLPSVLLSGLSATALPRLLASAAMLSNSLASTFKSIPDTGSLTV